MEILLTVAYIFLIRLVFFDYKWLKFNIYWGVGLSGFYAAMVLLEIVILGQVSPLAKEAVVQGYTLPIQSQWPGYIKEVYVEPNKPIKKGDKLYLMDTTQWANRLEQKKAELIKAQRLLKDAQRLTPTGAMAKEQLLLRTENVNHLKAEVEKAQYNVDHSLVRAPSNGYSPIVLIKPGVFHGMINKRVMTFVCTDKLWIVAKVPQQAVRNIKAGDKVEAALEMYPGTILYGKVLNVIWAVGNAQVNASTNLPADTIQPAKNFYVKIELDPKKDCPLHYGASGSVVIYTGKASFVFKLIRRIEIRSEAFLNYIYNPF